MHTVTIPLKLLGDKVKQNPEELLKAIQDLYITEYLAFLGVAATPANKAAALRDRPLDDCQIHAVWSEGDNRGGAGPGLADELRIVPWAPKRRGKASDGCEALLADPFVEKWYGATNRIDVRPPDISSIISGATTLKAADDSSVVDPGLQPTSAVAPENVAQALAAELEHMRKAGVLMGRAGGGKGADQDLALDVDRVERYKQELASLKSKFIMPFACERIVKHSGGEVELCPWQAEGPIALELPDRLKKKVAQPIRSSLEDIQRSNLLWISDSLPLEMLTCTKDDTFFKLVRASLAKPTVSRLIGLLLHLLYWVVLGVNRPDQKQCLTPDALQVMFTAVEKLWSGFEKHHRDSPEGVNLILPTLLLTVKRGVERGLEVQYPSMMADDIINGAIVDRINTLMMRLFDPDCMYARFGKFDGTGRALKLTKRLEMMSSGSDRTQAKRLFSRLNRTTPLLRASIGGGIDVGVANAGSGASASALGSSARTQAMLSHSEPLRPVPGSARSKVQGSGPADLPPISCGPGAKGSLLKATMKRLAFPVPEPLGTKGKPR